MESNTKKVTSTWAKVLIYIALSLGAIIMLFPFIFMILTSFKTYSESIAVPPKLLPEIFQFENYKTAMEMAPFDVYFKNTVISAVGNTVLTIFVTIFAAFAENARSHCGAMTPGVLQIVVK